MQVVRLGEFTPSIVVAVAEAIGALDAIGVSIASTAVASSPAQFRALTAGELDVVLTSPDNVIAYRLVDDNPIGSKLSVQIIGAIDRGLGLGLYGRRGWQTRRLGSIPLRLGVDVPGSGFAFTAYELLRQIGVERDQYEIVALGSTPRRAQALVDDKCDLTMLNAGNQFLALRHGVQLIAMVTDTGPYLGTVIARMTDLGTEMRQLTDDLTAALVTTAGAIAQGQYRELVEASAVALLTLTKPEASEFRRGLMDPAKGLVANGRVDEASMHRLVELRRASLPTPALDLVMGALPDLCSPAALPLPAEPKRLRGA